MANGDKAAAVGFDTVASSADIRNGYDEINKSRDYIAEHMTDGSHRADQITSGVLLPARGGTGRSNVYTSTSASTADPVGGPRLVVVSSTGHLSALAGKVGAAYQGRDVVGGVYLCNFSAGHDVIEHNLGWVPAAFTVTPRLDNIPLLVTRSANPPSSTGAGVMAFVSDTGVGFTGTCNVEWIAWRAA